MLKVANSVINASMITGVLPVANGGTGVTTSTGTGNTVLSASPTLSGDVNFSTGNLVIGTAGKGIDFSITSHPAGMTSELLADYEEGTWTPTIASSAGTITTSVTSGNYTKVGNLVTVQASFQVTNVGTASGYAEIAGLPYTVKTGITAVPFIVDEFDNTGIAYFGYLRAGNVTGAITTLTAGNLIWLSNNRYIFTVTYLAA